MAVELRSRGVASVSLWPGAVKTELVSQLLLAKDSSSGDESKVDSSLPAAPFLSRLLQLKLNLCFVFVNSLKRFLLMEKPQN